MFDDVDDVNDENDVDCVEDVDGVSRGKNNILDTVSASFFLTLVFSKHTNRIRLVVRSNKIAVLVTASSPPMTDDEYIVKHFRSKFI